MSDQQPRDPQYPIFCYQLRPASWRDAFHWRALLVALATMGIVAVMALAVLYPVFGLGQQLYVDAPYLSEMEAIGAFIDGVVSMGEFIVIYFSALLLLLLLRIRVLEEKDGELFERGALSRKRTVKRWADVTVQPLNGTRGGFAFLTGIPDLYVHRVAAGLANLYRIAYPGGHLLITPKQPAAFEAGITKRGARILPADTAPTAGTSILNLLKQSAKVVITALSIGVLVFVMVAAYRILTDEPGTTDAGKRVVGNYVPNSPMLTRLYLAGGWNPSATIDGTPLLMLTNNLDVVGLLVSSGADVQARDARGNPVFAVVAASARSNTLAMLRLLVEKGADVNASGPRGSPIERAAEALWDEAGPALAVITFLLEKGADLKRWEMAPPLVAAAGSPGSRDPALIGLLLDKGADVNELSKGGASALVSALRGGRSDASEKMRRAVVDLLIQRGAKPVGTRDDLPVIYWAAARGYTDIMEWAMTHGADVHEVLNVQLGPDKSPRFRSFPLNAAAYHRNRTAVEHLLKRIAHADVNRPDEKGMTPLMIALSRYPATSGPGPYAPASKAIIDALIAAGATLGGESVLSPKYSASGPDGNTVLHLAAQAGLKSVVEWALGKGAAIDARNQAGRTPLDLALASKGPGAAETAALLKDKGAQPGAAPPAAPAK